LCFRKASRKEDFEQIHALNHRVFAEEIGQHAQEPSGSLADRFHLRNAYYVGVQGERLIGMISAHAGPEFSVRRRLPDPEVLAGLVRPLEVRLLAIEPEARNRTVLAGLLWMVYEHAASEHYSHLLISGIVEREAMYRRMGFAPLGPPVREGAACFLPMIMPVNGLEQIAGSRVERHRRYWRRRLSGQAPARLEPGPVRLMSGPVRIHAQVAEAFARAPVAHRYRAFIDGFEQARSLLRALMPGLDVAILPGSGTLANAIAANLRAIFGDREGLVISNGEFGERLRRQAEDAGLRFRHLRFEWGQPWELDAVIESMERRPAWLWAVHLETSTGVLNDLQAMFSMAGEHGTAVALDCVSRLGGVAVPGGRMLYLASGVSGKCLGSYAGLACVFVSAECRERLGGRRVCRSFDLPAMLETCGPSMTIASPLLLALLAALKMHYGSPVDTVRRFAQNEAMGALVRRGLRGLGLAPLAPDAIAAPGDRYLQAAGGRIRVPVYGSGV
jgi:aspartate aminotransferase-like enzyme